MPRLVTLLVNDDLVYEQLVQMTHGFLVGSPVEHADVTDAEKMREAGSKAAGQLAEAIAAYHKTVH